MSPITHKIYISTMVLIVISVTIILAVAGIPYYQTSLEERFYHPGYPIFKSSGLLGHGLGIAGTLLIVIGVFGYMARKRYKFLSRIGVLKHWLEFHIFLCVLGPILILFHTAFKFGGLVAISFWSMVAVVASGVIGRFIYLQIPRTIEGRELSLNEIKENKNEIQENLKSLDLKNIGGFETLLQVAEGPVDNKKLNLWQQLIRDRRLLREIKRELKKKQVDRRKRRILVGLIRNELSLNRRIERLATMQKLFRYWHVAHLPFALVMLVIMVIHVAITLAFGYKWIF